MGKNQPEKLFTYNHSNQLTGISQGGTNYSYAYNGFGDRLRQTAGGNTVNYVIDSSSGLSQVLADGTNTYLYGLDRISQSYADGKDYFLGDALGSVRQMANTSGGITLSRNYEPYGTTYGAMGSKSSSYGFTSEWTDGTGLVNLRARYYDTGTGRFVSRDSWGGNYNRALSLNKWAYAYANPVNYIDPSGNIPSPSEIKEGQQVFSCNCGWIDFGHANSSIAMSVLNSISTGNELLSQLSNGCNRDIFVIALGTKLSGVGQVSKMFEIQSGLDQATNESVALGVYRSFMEDIEIAQKNLWFTNYSFEDLSSDEIGFYLGIKYNKLVNPKYSDGVNGEAWKWLSSVCGFSSDREQAKLDSYKAYEVYSGSSIPWLGFLNLMLNTPHVTIWGSPLLCDVDGLCENEQKQWPTEFKTITPATINENWRYYNGDVNDLVKSGSFPGVYFVN